MILISIRKKAVPLHRQQSVRVQQEMDEVEPPAELLMPLLPYQKQFLGWALRQEQGDIKGGILADEMGMGKTIQVCSPIPGS